MSGDFESDIVEAATKFATKANEINKTLKKFNSILDDRDGYSPGWKFNEWELKGIPIRIEIGPKDLEKKQVVLVRRDTGEKKSVKINSIKKEVDQMLDDIQDTMFKKAKNFLNDSIDFIPVFVHNKKNLSFPDTFLLPSSGWQ